MEKQFLKAVKAGDIDKARQLLSESPSLLNARDSDSSTPLHCAAWKGHVEIVKLILDSGGDVNATNENDHWGTTPLHAAAHANQAAIAKMLIERGADVNAKDGNGKTPLDHTAIHKATAAAKVLKAAGARLPGD